MDVSVQDIRVRSRTLPSGDRVRVSIDYPNTDQFRQMITELVSSVIRQSAVTSEVNSLPSTSND